MAPDKSSPDVSLPGLSRRADWIWKIGLVIETPQLLSEIRAAISDAGAGAVFELRAASSSFEVANVVEREKPDILFVELARTSKPAAEWMADVRRSEDTPLVVAVHTAPEPGEMIEALRAGASEFISLPVRPAVFEAMERIGALLESRRSAMVERGTIAGVLSSKGGCGATSIACHLSAALQLAVPSSRVLVADLDCQSPAARHVFRANPRTHAGNAFDAVRSLGSNSWREFVTSIGPGIDLLASAFDSLPGALPGTTATLPEQWRVESLFRFISRQYAWILVDLGRHLNPANWTLLQNIDELFIVTAPDVLALYQTRSVLQTLTGRGFDKGRVKIILNRNLSSPQDFWVESIEQMFEMTVFGVIPNDDGTLQKLPRDCFEFPGETPFGRAIAKIAGRLVRPNAPGPGFMRKAA
jgi:Flp pilus assembly CpaE family ATPase